MDRAEILGRLIEVTTGVPPLRRPARLGSACQELLGADGTSITIDSAATYRVTLTATDPMAARLEDLQDVLGQGPCHQAYEAAEPVTVELGSDTDERWPEFSRSAVAAVGPLTVRCFPIRPAGRPIGVLSSYVTDGRDLAADLVTAQFLADALGVTLLREPVEDDWSDLRDQWSPRSVVHLATGMIADQLRLSTDDALTLLRAHAYATDEPLTDIAQYVVSRRLHFGL